MKKDEYFDFIVNKLGTPTSTRLMPTNDRAVLEKILPERFIEIWADHDLPIFNHGEYALANPLEWEGVIDDWINASHFKEFRPFYAISKDAFGAIRAYSPSLKDFVLIDPIHGRIRAPSLNSVSDGETSDEELRINIDVSILSKSSEKINIVLDRNGRRLFPQALAKLGPLEWDEMYTFEPALFLGGSGTLESIAKVKAAPQYGVLLSLLGEVDSLTFKMPPGFGQ